MAAANKIKQYRALRLVCANQIKDIKELADQAVTDINCRVQFKMYCSQLQEIREEFKQNHQNLIALAAVSEEDLTQDESVRKHFDFDFSHVEAIYHTLFENQTNAPVANSTTSRNNNNVRLPKVEIPKFAGDVKTFKPFLDMFKSLIHSNPELTNIEKFNYLISSLRGPPLNLVQTTPMCDQNYEIAYNALLKRYDNKRLIAFAHLQEIDNAPIVTHSKNTRSLRSLLDTFTENLAALNNMEFPVKEWDFLLYYIFSKHLDQETITRFELEEPIVNNGIPSFESLRNFVLKRCNALDAIEFSVSKSQPTSFKNKYVQNIAVSKPKQTSSTYFSNSMKHSLYSCAFCKRNHSIYKCPEYFNKTPQDRLHFVQQNKLCNNCLSTQHALNNCKSILTCRFCSGKHHSSLHINKNIVNPNASQNVPTLQGETHESQGASNSQSNITFNGMVSSSNTVLLATAIINVQDVRNYFQKVRILLDSGSQTNYISQKCFNRLGLPRYNYCLSIRGLGSMTEVTSSGGVTCKLKPVGKGTPIITIDAVILPKLCNDLPKEYIDHSSWSHIHDIELADDKFYLPGSIDMLLGAEIFPHILEQGRITGKVDTPVAINTIFGYILMGSVANNIISPLSDTKSFSSFETDSFILDNSIKRFWELEEVPYTTILSPEDALCEELFRNTVVRDETGRYVVTLPFKNNDPIFPFKDIRDIALRRFFALEKRLLCKPDIYKQYSDFLKEYIDLGYLEEIKNSHEIGNVFYLPHHYVLKDSISTKLRVVFDASAKTTQGVSLNDTLLIGPKLQKDIFTILLNFRLHAIVFTADIQKMFLQILVTPKHRDYQRILWRFSPDEEIKDFRLTRVAFGLSVSPYLANRTILQLAHDERSKFTLAADVLENDIYVDDVVTGCDSLENAQEVRDQIIGILKEGNFELRKWSSNSQILLNDLPKSHLYSSQSFSFDAESGATIKILGLQWQPSRDIFNYHIDSMIRDCTKRSILSEIARIFDPLGFLTPLTIYAKILMQRLWSLGIQWDQKPPVDICENWYQYKSQFCVLNTLEIPRRILPENNYHSIEIHAFCDASEKAYASVIYFRVHSSSPDNFQTYLVCAKSKVAPLKTVSIPRLELCAAVLLSDLLSGVLKSLGKKITFSEIFAYTDSSIVLDWIQSSPHKRKAFVSNRVTHIQKRISPSLWHHISSENNIADCASRGLLPSEFINYKAWLTGPPWLRLEKRFWPISNPHFNLNNDTCPDYYIENKDLSLATFNCPNLLDSIINKYSSFSKIKRIIAHVFRFLYNCRNRDEKKVGNFHISELNEASLFIIKFVQQMNFASDIANLKNSKTASKFLRKLNAFIDPTDGILRVGGRIKNSSLPYNQKHPAILPRNARITELIILEFHKIFLHPGAQALHHLLIQQYWILSPKRAIRNVITKCQKCWRLTPKSYQPKMGNLPSLRVSEIKAFSCVGIDYAGPFNVTMGKIRGSKTYKAYICLFVCFATKCIHLELASDLTSDAFIAALRRFIARRGRVAKLFSDCGSNFLGASNQISNLMKLAAEAENIEFNFHPSGSPHFSGLAEAGVKSVKTHIYRVVGEQSMTFEEFYTLLTQIEALLNSRPLCPLSIDPNDISVLTPGHFLTLEPLSSLPDPDLSHLKINRLSRWQLLQRLHQSFWQRWRNEYLHTLQQRGKWLESTSSPSIGTMVLIRDETSSPMKWPLGRIVKLYFGEDGIARVADVRTKQSILKRALVKLCPLPMPEN